MVRDKDEEKKIDHGWDEDEDQSRGRWRWRKG